MEESRSILIRLRADVPHDGNELLQRYSRFKLGCTASVDYYARALLNPIVRALSAAPEKRRVITGPAITALPAAANILAWRINELIQLAAGRQVTSCARNIVKLPVSDWLSSPHYAKLQPSKRRDAQGRSRMLWRKEKWLSGASLVVVNDVFVTGAQEGELRRFFSECKVAAVHWQYIAEFDVECASAASTLEPRLNDLTIRTDDDFIRYLSDTRAFTPTTKLIWRLFELDAVDFRRAVDALSPRQKRKICLLIGKTGTISIPSLLTKIEYLGLGT